MKTRIREVDGLYYPERRSWGLWHSIAVERDIFGTMYYSNNLRIAKSVIDRYLEKNKHPITRIIEYPKPEE